MATISPSPYMQFFDSNGDPLSGGKVYTYDEGTTTAKATYTDAGGLVENANPVVLDSAGRGDIWLGSGGYKFVVKTSADVTVKTVDGISAEPDTGEITNAMLADNTIRAAKLDDSTDARSAEFATTIKWLPFGANAEYQTVQQGFRNLFINVKSFGATGDGVTDDRDAINDAIQAAEDAGGGCVYFPAGTYIIQSQVPLTSNLRLTGDGPASVIKVGASMPKMVDSSGGAKTNIFYCSGPSGRTGGDHTSFVATHDITIDNLAFDGGLTNSASSGAPIASMVGYVIQIGTSAGLTLSWTSTDSNYYENYRFKRFTIRDCYFKNIPGSAIWVANARDVDISHNRFINMNTAYYTSGGAIVSAGSAAEVRGCSGVRVVGNYVRSEQAGHDWHGFTLISNYDEAIDYTVANNVIQDLKQGDGISCEMNIANTGAITFTGNRIRDVVGQGIGCDISAHAHIVGNYIDGATLGINLSSTRRFTVVGNVIKNALGNGIVARAMPDLSDEMSEIIGNQIDDVEYVSINYNGSGIFILKGGTTYKLNVTISGNTIRNVDAHGIYVAGTSATVTSNIIKNYDRANGLTVRTATAGARPILVDSGGIIANNHVMAGDYNYRYGLSILGAVRLSGNVLQGTYSTDQYEMTSRPTKTSVNGAVITNATELTYDPIRDHLVYTAASGSAPTHKSCDGDIVYNASFDASAAGTFAWAKASGNNTTWTAKTW